MFDALEDAQGALWLATPGGLERACADRQFPNVVPGGPLLIDFVVTLCAGPDGAIWAGTYGKGLWRVKGDERRLYTDGRRAVERPDPLALRGCGGNAVDRHFRRRAECAARRQVRRITRRATAC